MLMKNSAEFKINLNAKSNGGMTAFHMACKRGRTSIVDIMMNNSESFNLNLTVRDNHGKTGFQLAQARGKTDVVNMIQTKMQQIAF